MLVQTFVAVRQKLRKYQQQQCCRWNMHLCCHKFCRKDASIGVLGPARAPICTAIFYTVDCAQRGHILSSSRCLFHPGRLAVCSSAFVSYFMMLSQEEGSCRGIKRSHSTTTTASNTKRRSLDCARIRSISSDESGDIRAEAAHSSIHHGHHDNSYLDIPPTKAPFSPLQQFVPPQQQQHLPMQRWQPADNPFQRPEDLSQVAMQLNSSSEEVFAPEASNSESDSSMGDGPFGDVRPPLRSFCSFGERGPREPSAQSVTLDELLDDTVRDLSGLSVKCRSAPVMISGRCATVDALNESLSNGCLNAMLDDGHLTSRRASCCPAMQIRRDGAPAMCRAFSSASHGLVPTSQGGKL